MDISGLVFAFFAVLAVALSLGVVLFRNPIASGLSLIGSFFAVSALFIMLSASFLGVMQVLIYAGAIMVLFLYVMMLLNIHREETSSSILKRGMTLVIVSILIGIIAKTLPSSLWLTTPSSRLVSEAFGGIHSVGEILLRQELLPFEFVSLILLIGIVGVVALSNETRRKS